MAARKRKRNRTPWGTLVQGALNAGLRREEAIVGILMAARTLEENGGKFPFEKPKRLPIAPHTRTWTPDRIVAALQADADRRGRPPSYREWERAGPDRPTAQVVLQRFGSWNAGLRAASLKTRERPPVAAAA